MAQISNKEKLMNTRIHFGPAKKKGKLTDNRISKLAENNINHT